jgi:putative DNA primase/helicase
VTTLAEAARRYAEHGWHVFPLADRDKVPRDGFAWKELATNDVETVRRWWRESPDANIALVPGPSGLVVVDIDSNTADVVASWLGLTSEPTLEVRTGRSDFPGRHLYFRYRGSAIGNLKVTVTDDRLIAVKTDQRGLEIKHANGYVCAPPSVHPATGRRYLWVKDGYEPQPLPTRAAQLIQALPQNTPGPRDAEDGPGLVLTRGTRNHSLTKVAGFLRRGGCSARQIEAMLGVLNADAQPPLPDKEVCAIARSVARYRPEPPAAGRRTGPPLPAAHRGPVIPIRPVP